MVQTAKKTQVLSLTACLATLFIAVSAMAKYEDAQGGTMLQPQGLDRAGIYALRQIDPSLTGTGVQFALICRSFTYIDGKPQNDYRPNIEHDCFGTSQFSFHDDGRLPSGISPHSTAICSILLGEDRSAYHPEIWAFHYQGSSPTRRRTQI
jgi:hypothetical protein